MTAIISSADRFSADAVAGLVDAYSEIVRGVDGGVARAASSRSGKVAVVIGGGAGHYPAFAGLVGSGVADGAAIGEVFASPSTRRVAAVARAVESGGGVLLVYGNYQGDVLNFEAAAERMRADGIDVRSVAVTDDIASAPQDQKERRRGVAGDLVVMKLAGAAAELGAALDDVHRVAEAANDRTRSFGVAFSGCTLPGAESPLFSLPEGTMAIGMGIHGEPGLGEKTVLPASEIGTLLVDGILAELPDVKPGAKVAVVLNGLGSTGAEELFVLWAAIAPILRERGLRPVAPEVGAFATSLDMAGCSLTLCVLDDELERLWFAPALTVGFRRGAISEHDAAVAPAADAERPSRPEDSDGGHGDSSPAARAVVNFLAETADVLAQAEQELGRLDSLAGDGDHGAGMARGSAAALQAGRVASERGLDAGRVLEEAGEAWADRAGGTSGMLWGEGLVAAGREIAATDVDLHDPVLRRAAIALVDRIAVVGGAARGDKTMLDAALPFRDALDVGLDWTDAAAEAAAGAETSASLVPRRGRARTAGTRNAGQPDPGAVSFALVAKVFAQLGKDRPV